WTNDKDSFILNHLLTDASIKIDTNVIDAMIATWPESFGDKPTRKAFAEHFSKVRKNNKGLASGTATLRSTRRPRMKPRLEEWFQRLLGSALFIMH
ncbi:unnamed protein product, partial [Aureobasidium pullulans]